VEKARSEVRLVHLMFHLKTREVLTDEHAASITRRAGVRTGRWVSMEGVRPVPALR
jgi:hypothetical protein